MTDINYYIPGKDVDFILVGDIDKKVKRINFHQEYSNTLKNRIINTLNEEANTHSFAMEIPNSEVLSDKHHRCLRDAWNWAEENYQGEFSHNFIIELARKIEPSSNHNILDKGLSYRKENVRLDGRNPPHVISSQKIPEAMEGLIYFLNNSSENPLVRAIFGHMHFIRNHPFCDGNGRTARMMQNLILNYNHFPPIRIERGERDFYQMVIGNALNELENRLSLDHYKKNGGMKLFFEYLASIENITLDRIEEELKRKREFGIYVEAKGVEKIYSVEHALKSARDRGMKGKGVTIRLDKGKRMVIVKGDISFEEIEPVVRGLKNRGTCCKIVSIV